MNRRVCRVTVVLLLAPLLVPASARAGFVFVSNFNSGVVGKYDATTGAAINASFITGLNTPNSLALNGSGQLFVTNFNSGVVGEYDATTGAAINASFITGLNTPNSLALNGSGQLFVTNFN